MVIIEVDFDDSPEKSNAIEDFFCLYKKIPITLKFQIPTKHQKFFPFYSLNIPKNSNLEIFTQNFPSQIQSDIKSFHSNSVFS